MKRKFAKMEAEESRETEKRMIEQMQKDNKMWAPVDDEDARHLKKQS